MADRLDIGLRYVPSCESFTINYGGGGNQTLTLTGTDLSAAAIASSIDTAVKTVNAALSCTESAGKYTIASSALTFTITWTHPSLRDWLGFRADIVATTSAISDETSPAVCVSSLPWAEDVPGRRYVTKRYAPVHDKGRSLLISNVRTWQVLAKFGYAELSQWRSVSRYLLQGYPATWYRNDADTAAWSWSNFDGKVEVILDPGQLSYEDGWLDDSIFRDMAVRLSFVEFAA